MSRYPPSEAGKGCNRREGKGYEEGYDRIFTKKKTKKGRYIQDRVTGKLIHVDDYQGTDTDTGRKSAAILGDFNSFISPIDGSVIDDRGKLREHNKRHNVTNVADYSQDYLAKRRAQNQPSKQELKTERLNAIRKARHAHGYYD